MKKAIKFILLSACMATLLLPATACGGNDKASSAAANNENSAEDSKTSDAAPAVTGETFDTGMFTVTVPGGWLAMPATNNGEKDPAILTLIKDGKEEWDALDHAWIRINIYDKGSLLPTKELYDDAKDMDPVTVSGFECTVFSCTSADYPYVILEGTNDKNDISIAILTKNDLSAAAYEDADVQAILKREPLKTSVQNTRKVV